MADADAQKRLKALNKKLTQISKLKEKAQFSQEEKEKVDSEPAILEEIRALETGKPLHEVKAEQEAAKAPSPAKSAQEETLADAAPQNEGAGAAPQQFCETEPEETEAAAEAAPNVEEEVAAEAAEMQPLEPAEAEKRIKAVKKKLAQIEKLKEKGDDLSPEEREKVGRQAGFEAEIQEIEIGLLDPETKKNAVTLQRKLDQVRKLKEKGGQLNAQEREKVSKAPALLKELQGILESKKAGN